VMFKIVLGCDKRRLARCQSPMSTASVMPASNVVQIQGD